LALRTAANLFSGTSRGDLPESFGYSLKRRLLGPPMVNEELRHQRLSNFLALGVLSPDGISSSAYGTEEMLIELLPLFGLAAFAVILPMTGVILFVMALVVLSYREVVTVYTRAGGSYVVARENFGPRIAQVAAVALLIDYVVTVAVQVAGGTAAVASAIPVLGPYSKEISVGVVLIMCYGNLRGIREAGKAFALPTYLFTAAVVLMIVVGLLRDAMGNLHPQDVHNLTGQPAVQIGAGAQGVALFAVIFTLLRSFANGGSSLTGIEAVSNAVSAFRPPEGLNARKVLVAEGIILGTLVAGISWLAHVTHAIPRVNGYPTVISQEADMVFGSGIGHIMYYVVQAVTALILYTGGNTSFNGFPFLTSFVAEDSFLPRWMTKRGHRLVFSNGIIALTIPAVALLVFVGSNVNRLVPFYAIGVFTAFSMAGFGMAKYHHRVKEQGWRRKFVINFSAGVLTSIVVVVFAIVKFTEGAWLILIIFPVMVYLLIQLNRRYRMEAEVLENIGGRKVPDPPNYTRRTVLVLVDEFNLATIAALRYARGLRPTALRAVHFVIDTDRAKELRDAWLRADRGIPLDLIDCPDRRVPAGAAELVTREAAEPGTHVTVVLPRRSYPALLGRLLHDQTADKIARVVSRIPRCAATIIPFDVEARIEVLHERQTGQAARVAKPAAQMHDHDLPALRPGITPIASLTRNGRATVEGRVHSLEIRPVEHSCVLACQVADGTGEITALFYGRTHIPGVEPGIMIQLRGRVGVKGTGKVMVNPAYELLS
jgi:amino acid transporter